MPAANRGSALAAKIRQCEICAAQLPAGPKPIVQLHSKARILIASQAPGRLAHESGVPFQDPSGRRLRDWLGLNEQQFYDPKIVAILPMGFCYPGTGKGGDLPPLPQCAEHWRQTALSVLPEVRLTLIIGQYAQRWHLPNNPHKNLTETVRHWRELPAGVMALPHPSPRNNIWLRKNDWFEAAVLPELRDKVRTLVAETGEAVSR